MLPTYQAWFSGWECRDMQAVPVLSDFVGEMIFSCSHCSFARGAGWSMVTSTARHLPKNIQRIHQNRIWKYLNLGMVVVGLNGIKSFPLCQFGEKPTTSNISKALNRLRALISLATKASASLRYTEQNKQCQCPAHCLRPSLNYIDLSWSPTPNLRLFRHILPFFFWTKTHWSWIPSATLRCWKWSMPWLDWRA